MTDFKAHRRRPVRELHKSPDPYGVESVVVATNDRDGVTLAGTLTIPVGEGPFPAVVLLSVAGPNDRDQSFAGHAGFRVLAVRRQLSWPKTRVRIIVAEQLADHLTRNGVAT